MESDTSSCQAQDVGVAGCWSREIKISLQLLQPLAGDPHIVAKTVKVVGVADHDILDATPIFG